MAAVGAYVPAHWPQPLELRASLTVSKDLTVGAATQTCPHLIGHGSATLSEAEGQPALSFDATFSSMGVEAPGPSYFVVVLAAESAARFREDEPPMIVQDFPTSVGTVTLTFRTRFADEGHEAKVPREMWIDVRGEATCTLEEAVNAYSNAGLAFLPVIALTTNASIEDAQPKLAFDNTRGRTPREYVQSFVPERGGVLLPGRRVDVEATLTTILTLGAHPETNRLHRAAEQYRLALSHWTRGRESLALMHLYMGIETLMKSALRRECTSAGDSESELADAWGIQVEGEPAPVWRRNLDAEVRRRVLFKGDGKTLAKARKASDGLEHGFLDFVSTRTLAEEARDQTAVYLREAIFDLAAIDADTRCRMLTHPYDKPLKSWLARYLRGRFHGETDDLAAPGQEYPIFKWKSGIKSLSRSATGGYKLEPSEALTAQFSEDVKFEQVSFEVWGPEAGMRVGVDDDSEEP